MRRVAPLAVVAALLAGCGDSAGPSPRATPGGDADGRADAAPPLANGETGAGTAPAAPPGVPDGGVAAGHGADAGERFAQRVRGRVEVPPSDRTPPLALLRLQTGAEAVVHDSPVRPAPRPAVRLRRPELRATALIRDADGGTGRVRVSIVYATRCDGAERQHAAYFPPAQLETIRIAPGVRVPAERVRSGRVAFPPGCTVSGKAFAEATNAHSLESFSDPIWFEYRP